VRSQRARLATLFLTTAVNEPSPPGNVSSTHHAMTDVTPYYVVPGASVSVSDTDTARI